MKNNITEIQYKELIKLQSEFYQKVKDIVGSDILSEASISVHNVNRNANVFKSKGVKIERPLNKKSKHFWVSSEMFRSGVSIHAEHK